MEDITIRQAGMKDFAAMQALDDGLFRFEHTQDSLINDSWIASQEGKSWLSMMLTNQNCVCFLAEKQNQSVGILIGMCLAADTKRPVARTQLLNIFIKTEYRHQGIGKKLLDTFILWSKEKKAQRILVSSAAWNKEAISFYKKSNFQPYQILLEKSLEPV